MKTDNNEENYLYINNLSKVQYYQGCFNAIFEVIKATGCQHKKINWFLRDQLYDLIGKLSNDYFFEKTSNKSLNMDFITPETNKSLEETEKVLFDITTGELFG